MALSYLIDSDVCIAQLAGEDRELATRWFATPHSQIALCSVVLGELHSGAWRAADPLSIVAQVNRLFSAYACLPYDNAAAMTYGRIVASMRKKGIDVGPGDSMIGAIALTHGLTVVTRNMRHFRRIPELRVTRW